jgi:antagonist of KipI
VIIVDRAPPYLTVQDAGRVGYGASGVPRSGAMDQWALESANRIVGNPSGAAALEWAIGAGSLRFECNAVISLTGAVVDATADGAPVAMNAMIAVTAGQQLDVNRLTARRFLYIGIRGGVGCPVVLGSRSTYLPAAMGGIDGRRLAHGDVIPMGNTPATRTNDSGAPAANRLEPDYDSAVIRIIAAIEQFAMNGSVVEATPQDSSLMKSFLAGHYTVSLASDRTGYRLEGDQVLESADTSITSEPVCAGTIQLPPGGHPIVLMADSPTIGGYRILGAVISSDLPILAQSVPGRMLTFARVNVEAAQRLVRGA